MKTIKQYQITPNEVMVILKVPENTEFISVIPKYDRYITLSAIVDTKNDIVDKTIYCFKVGYDVTVGHAVIGNLKFIGSVYLHKYTFIFHIFVGK